LMVITRLTCFHDDNFPGQTRQYLDSILKEQSRKDWWNGGHGTLLEHDKKSQKEKTKQENEQEIQNAYLNLMNAVNESGEKEHAEKNIKEKEQRKKKARDLPKRKSDKKYRDPSEWDLVDLEAEIGLVELEEEAEQHMQGGEKNAHQLAGAKCSSFSVEGTEKKDERSVSNPLCTDSTSQQTHSATDVAVMSTSRQTSTAEANKACLHEDTSASIKTSTSDRRGQQQEKISSAAIQRGFLQRKKKSVEPAIVESKTKDGAGLDDAVDFTPESQVCNVKRRSNDSHNNECGSPSADIASVDFGTNHKPDHHEHPLDLAATKREAEMEALQQAQESVVQLGQNMRQMQQSGASEASLSNAAKHMNNAKVHLERLQRKQPVSVRNSSAPPLLTTADQKEPQYNVQPRSPTEDRGSSDPQHTMIGMTVGETSTIKSVPTVVRAKVDIESDEDEEEDEETSETVERMRRKAEETARIREVSILADDAGSAVLETKSAAAHTYDRGYEKWDKFDVNEALKDTEPVTQRNISKSDVPNHEHTREGLSQGFLKRAAEKTVRESVRERNRSEGDELGSEEDEAKAKTEKEQQWERAQADRKKVFEAQKAEEKIQRDERKEAYNKKKIEDGFGQAWNDRPKKLRAMEDWDKFDVDAELDSIEEEDRRSRGLSDHEIRNEKVLEIMQDEQLSEKEKMEKCMHMSGHKDYEHKETEEDKARREAQDLINIVQDPRRQPREKMHFLHEAHKKFGDPKTQVKPSQEKLQELQAQMSDLVAKT